jgi:hypothetical protein
VAAGSTRQFTGFKFSANSQLSSHFDAKQELIRHTPSAMLRHSTFAAVLWVIAVAMLPVRMANAHLHFCLDGQTQPVSLHVQDLPTHHGSDHEDDGHNDRDVDFSASALAAKHSGSSDDHAFDLLSAYVVAFLLPLPSGVAPVAPEQVSYLSSPVDLRPPVRGPPL